MKKTNIIILVLILLNLAVVFADDYLFDVAELSDETNVFLEDSDSQLTMLIPTFLLIISIVSFALDFGTVGVVTAAMLGLTASFFIGFLALNVISITSFIVMGGMLIYKLAT